MGYKILGYTVWHGGKWYLRRRYGTLLPSRRVVIAGAVGALVAMIAVAGARRELGTE